MADQDGMRAIGAAVAALAEDPLPGEGFHAGEYHRLRVGSYRVVYILEADLIPSAGLTGYLPKGSR
jgi:hypothetical protein